MSLFPNHTQVHAGWAAHGAALDPAVTQGPAASTVWLPVPDSLSQESESQRSGENF